MPNKRTFLCLRRAIFPVVSTLRRSSTPSAKSTEAYGKFRMLHGKRLLHRPLLICSQDKYWSHGELEEDHEQQVKVHKCDTMPLARYVTSRGSTGRPSRSDYVQPDSEPLFQSFSMLILLRSMDRVAYFLNTLNAILGAFGEPAI